MSGEGRPVEERPFWDLRDTINASVDLAAAAGVDRHMMAKALLVAACDAYGNHAGFEHIAAWLRAATEAFGEAYPIVPDGVIRH